MSDEARDAAMKLGVRVARLESELATEKEAHHFTRVGAAAIEQARREAMDRVMEHDAALARVSVLEGELATSKAAQASLSRINQGLIAQKQCTQCLAALSAAPNATIDASSVVRIPRPEAVTLTREQYEQLVSTGAQPTPSPSDDKRAEVDAEEVERRMREGRQLLARFVKYVRKDLLTTAVPARLMSLADSVDDYLRRTQVASDVLRESPKPCTIPTDEPRIKVTCPCMLVGGCEPSCSCANPFLSGGCRRCASYGDESQRLEAASYVAECISAGHRVLYPKAATIPTDEAAPGSVEPESWWYADHPDDERWEHGGASREEAIAEALASIEPGETIYVVLGVRPPVEDFARCYDSDDLLDTMTNYGSDNGMLGDDHELEFDDAKACEEEVRAVIARHLIRPSWWTCDGSQAEAVTKPKPASEPEAPRAVVVGDMVRIVKNSSHVGERHRVDAFNVFGLLLLGSIGPRSWWRLDEVELVSNPPSETTGEKP